MAKPTAIPTLSPFSNELDQEKQVIQQPVQPPTLPPEFGILAGGSSIGLGITFAIWLLWDRIVKPWSNPKIARMMHSYTSLEAIKNIVQVVRSESNAQRAVLLELNTRNGLMFNVAQEVDSGYATIELSPNDSQLSCVKKILERFRNDEKFISKKVDEITVDSYKGFLQSHGVFSVIYCKVGMRDDINWILALHYFEGKDNFFVDACERFETQIIKRSNELFFQLMQQSPVKMR